MNKLMSVLERAGETGIKVLNNEAEGKQYVEDLLCVLDAIREAAPEDVDACEYPDNIVNTIRMDRYLIDGTLETEQDCLSLLSTLATYIEAYREDLPEHSKIYMDRVTDLRHVIDDVYGEKAMPFCGTGEC